MQLQVPADARVSELVPAMLEEAVVASEALAPSSALYPSDSEVPELSSSC